MKKMVALYKAYRGGEWFDASLQSVKDHVDGVVVVYSNRAWDGGDAPNNCIEVGSKWARPGWFHITSIESSKSSDQYAEGLRVIRNEYGKDTAVLIIDTDELWETSALVNLKRHISKNPNVHYFCGRLHSYLRSPLYQVYPQDVCAPIVALQCAAEQDATNRFQVKSFGLTRYVDDVLFHHFTYVRKDESEIAGKLSATSSQETVASKLNWIDTVWPKLPSGRNLHMTTGFESCWKEIKVLHKVPIPLPSFCTDAIAREDDRWRDRVQSQPHSEALIPTPNAADAAKYPEFAGIAADTGLLRRRLKMSYLEALVLYREAENCSRILEIGSGSGGSLAVMAIAAPRATLYAVDPFTPYDETNCGPTVRDVSEGNEAEFWETARYYGYVHRVRHVKLNSDIAVQKCPSEPFDLVLVDGNHTYEIAKNDIELYWPMVAKGGVMLVHDFTTRFPGVIRAVNESGLPFSVFQGTSLAYCRNSA